MWLRRSLDFLLYSHIYIGLCAVALCWGCFALFGGADTQYAFLIFSFCGTVWVYNLHRTVGLYITDSNRWPKRFREFFRLRYFNIALATLTLTTATYVFFNYLFSYAWYFIPPVAVSLIYVIPLTPKKLVRSIPYLKIFLISFTWSWITVVFPLIIMEVENTSLIALLAVERFLFIMAIDIPFDIRDFKQDTREAVDTIIHKLGVKGSKLLAIYLLIVCGILSLVVTYLTWVPAYYALVHIVVYLLSTCLVYYSNKRRKDSYYSFGLDGMMLLMGGLEVYLYYSL